jgi:hypothetical protein
MCENEMPPASSPNINHIPFPLGSSIAAATTGLVFGSCIKFPMMPCPITLRTGAGESAVTNLKEEKKRRRSPKEKKKTNFDVTA